MCAEGFRAVDAPRRFGIDKATANALTVTANVACKEILAPVGYDVIARISYGARPFFLDRYKFGAARLSFTENAGRERVFLRYLVKHLYRHLYGVRAAVGASDFHVDIGNGREKKFGLIENVRSPEARGELDLGVSENVNRFRKVHGA